MKELLKITIPSSMNGLMIKEILFDHFHFSRKSLSKIKLHNGIYLNGEAVYVTARVHTKDLLQIFTIEETSEDIIPQPIPVEIIYEDNDIVVINKQPNIVVHPTRNHYLGTIANGLLYYWKQQGKQYRFRPVNRLDKDTSGLFIVAKNQYSHHKLATQINENQLKRTYHAIVHGRMDDDNGEIIAPILKDPEHGVKRIIDFSNNNAKFAVTYYNVLKRFKDFTLVELQLGTGRTHQIRVHMSYLGHPLVGDDLYGGFILDKMSRQALHAKKLDFYQPLTEEYLSFSTDYPLDMTEFIKDIF